jgi:uncharacterized coiled-coil DUF342 family protein
MKTLIAERNQLNAEKNEITAARDAVRDRLTSLINNEKSMKADLKFSSVEAIDSQIRELEQRQSRSSMTLNEEKKLIKDIHNLQISKKTVAAISDLKENIEKEKTSRTDYDRRITEKNAELKLVNDRIVTQRAVLDNLNKDTTDGRDAIPNLRKTQTECREQVQEKFAQIKVLKAEFKKAEEVYNVFLAELAAKKREARQKEIEARAAEEEQRRKEL